MTANDYSKAGHLNTQDYAKLAVSMRLREWFVKLVGFPDWPEETPFGDWDVDDATQSLDWYDAYNAVKHDREAALDRAELRFVIRALAGFGLMLGDDRVTLVGALPVREDIKLGSSSCAVVR